MRSFVSFLFEVARTPERADKLANYLAHRHAAAGKVPPESYWGKKIALKDPINDNEASSVERAIVRHCRARKVESDRHLFDQHSKLQSLPIRSLRAGQDRVNHSSGQFHGFKMNDRRPIYVVKHKGQHIVYDGHHRWIRDRLLGQTHIHAHVYDLDEDVGKSKKKKSG